MQTKVCSKCGVEQGAGEFRPRRGSRSGLSSNCKTCVNIARGKWRQANREKLARERRERYAKNPAPEIEYAKARYAASPDEIRAYIASWRKSNPDRVRALAAQERDELRDNYVKAVIRGDSGLPRGVIPTALVEAKRVQLQIKRLLKERKA